RRAAREARLEGHRTRREVAAERDADHADALGVDVVARGEPFVADARPALALVRRVETVEPERLPGPRLIDAKRRDAAPRERVRQPRPVEELLAAVEAVDVEHARRPPFAAFGPRVKRRYHAAGVRDLDSLCILAADRDGMAENPLRLGIRAFAARMPVALHALGDEIVERRALELRRCGKEPAFRFVLGRKPHE